MNNSPICKTFVLSDYFFRDNILLFLITKPLKSNKKQPQNQSHTILLNIFS